MSQPIPSSEESRQNQNFERFLELAEKQPAIRVSFLKPETRNNLTKSDAQTYDISILPIYHTRRIDAPQAETAVMKDYFDFMAQYVARQLVDMLNYSHYEFQPPPSAGTPHGSHTMRITTSNPLTKALLEERVQLAQQEAALRSV